jgi:hypothetical protein
VKTWINIFWLGTKELRSVLGDGVMVALIIWSFSFSIYSPDAHRARTHPGERSDGALFALAPATRPAATLAATLVSQPPVVVFGSSRSIQQPALWRRPARRPHRGSGLGRFRIQVGEDLLDDVGILDTRDDPHRPTAGRAGLDLRLLQAQARIGNGYPHALQTTLFQMPQQVTPTALVFLVAFRHIEDGAKAIRAHTDGNEQRNVAHVTGLAAFEHDTIEVGVGVLAI